MRILRPFSSLIATSKNKVIHSTLVYTLAGGLNAAIPFFILPILTSYLTPQEYGIVSTFMVFNSIFLILVGLEQYSYISVNFYTQSVEVIRTYVTSISFVGVLSFFALTSVVLIFPAVFENLSQVNIKWIIFSVIVAFFQFLAQLSLTVWQLSNEPFRYGAFQVLHSLINYGLSIFLIAQFSLDEVGRIYGIVIAASLFGSYSIYYLVKNKLIIWKFEPEVMKAAILFSLPLIPHAFAGWVNTALDRLIINHYIGIAENGIYSINYQIAMVVGLVAGSFNKAFIPFVYKTLSTGDPKGKVKLVRYTYFYYVTLILMAIILAVASPFIIRFLVDDQYHQHQHIIYWIIVGFTADGLYYGVINYLFYSKKTKYISVITFSSCLIHFFVSLILIPRYGLVAAAWSTAISFVFSFVLAFIISNKEYPMPWFYFLRAERNVSS